jgi:hypothetical protein
MCLLLEKVTIFLLNEFIMPLQIFMNAWHSLYLRINYSLIAADYLLNDNDLTKVPWEIRRKVMDNFGLKLQNYVV